MAKSIDALVIPSLKVSYVQHKARMPLEAKETNVIMVAEIQDHGQEWEDHIDFLFSVRHTDGTDVFISNIPAIAIYAK